MLLLRLSGSVFTVGRFPLLIFLEIAVETTNGGTSSPRLFVDIFELVWNYILSSGYRGSSLVDIEP